MPSSTFSNRTKSYDIFTYFNKQIIFNIISKNVAWGRDFIIYKKQQIIRCTNHTETTGIMLFILNSIEPKGSDTFFTLWICLNGLRSGIVVIRSKIGFVCTKILENEMVFTNTLWAAPWRNTSHLYIDLRKWIMVVIMIQRKNDTALTKLCGGGRFMLCWEKGGRRCPPSATSGGRRQNVACSTS